MLASQPRRTRADRPEFADMLLLLLVLACSNHVPDPTTPDAGTTAQVEPAVKLPAQPEPAVEPAAQVEPGGGPEPATAPGDFETCMARCERANMARPVAPELIAADCRRTCTAEHVVRGKADLELRLGQRVRAIGTFQRQLHHGHGPEPYMGTAIVLEDGTPLWVSTGEPPKDWEGWLDKRVQVEGLLATGEENDPGIWLVERGAPQPADAL